MTYARARLAVGMSGVGTVVVLAAGALALGVPQSFLPTERAPLAVEAGALLAVLLIHAAILAPFDLFGGFILPNRYERTRMPAGRFVAKWMRGVSVQTAVVLAGSLSILAAGRAGGVVGAAAAFALVMVALVVAQQRLAVLLGGLDVEDRDARIRLVRASDPGFTGGVVGWPGRERMLVPQRWMALLGPDGMAAELRRWKQALDTKSRLFGVAVALKWNLSGFLIAAVATGGDVRSVAGLVSVALGFTLWSFVGLLVLPSVSRPAVFAADRGAWEGASDQGAIERTLSTLDRLQDDEPRRSAVIESVFHPIPALSRRLQAIGNIGGPTFGAWHAARTALFLSWAGFGLLSRAVHCNSGRPELWALLPCD